MSILFYGIINALPSGFVEQKALAMSQKPGAPDYDTILKTLKEKYGISDNKVKGYFSWLKHAVVLDFGDSWTWNKEVTTKFGEVIWNSFFLSLAAFILQVAIAVPLGIVAARKQYSKTDYAVTVFSLIGISLPGFFFASVLKYVFSIKLGWFDLFGAVGRNHNQLGFWGQIGDSIMHYILPVVTLTVIGMGSLMRYTRTNMLEVMNSDYIRTARAKGVSKVKIIFGHALKNALIPVITYFGPMLAYIVTGSLVVEQIFAVPGIGDKFVNSITNRDYPLIMGTTIILAVFIVIMNLISDILYKVVDPRINLE